MKKLLLALAFLALSLGAADAASRFAVCTVTCTWDNSSTAMWSASTGGATGASAPVAGDAVTLDAATCVGGVTCTITVNANLSMASLTMGACTALTAGCILDFSVNNNTVAITTNFSGTGTGTRSLKMGSSVWTLSAATGAVWNMATVTNLTFTAGTSTISLTGGSTNQNYSFSGGGLTYGTVNLNANNTVSIVGNNTFANLGITGPNLLILPTTGTTTISAAYTIAGTAAAPIGFIASVPSTLTTISVPSGTATCSWCSFHGITFSGGATFTAANSSSFGYNTGITITPPTGGSTSLSPGLH